MNRDDIIRMAREACDQAPREDWNSTAWVFGDESLVHFAELVATAEREACAKAVEIFDKTFQTGGGIAGSIRARGEK